MKFNKRYINLLHDSVIPLADITSLRQYFIMKKIICVLFLIVSGAGCSGGGNDGGAASADLRPGSLLIYYGWPSLINGASSVSGAAAQFDAYDYAVLGAGLEESSHGDHANTASIISASSAVFFGYVDLGVSTYNYTLAQIEAKIDAWKAMGVDGIFLDDFGYDYGVTRARQNAAADYAHGRGLCVVANAWDPDDVFGSAADAAANPDGAAPVVDGRDFYLSESFQIQSGAYQTESAWYAKAAKLEAYRAAKGFRVFAVTTNDAADAYDEAKFHYAWYSALLWGYAAAGWGNYLFSSDDNAAPARSAPDVFVGGSFAEGVVNASPVYTRRTYAGTVRIDTQTHGYGFTK